MSVRLQSWMPWIFFTTFFPFGAIFPYLVEDLQDKGIVELGLLLTLPSLMSLFAAPLWGILADWLGRWSIVLRLATFVASVGLWILLSFGLDWAFTGMLLYSIGLAPLTPITDALALEAVAEQPEKYGRFRLWGSVGYMVGVLSVAGIQYFYPVSALMIGFVMTALFALMAWFIPEPHHVEKTNLRKGLELVLQNRTLLWILACSAVHFSVHLANSNFLVVHLHDLDLGNIWVGISMAAGIIVEVIVLGMSKKLLERWTAVKLFQTAAGLAIFRWMGMAMFTSSGLIVFTQASHGLSFGLFWVAAIHLVKEHTPKEAKATGQSLLAASVGGVGASVGVYAASVIVENFDTVMMYWVSSGVALLAYLMTRRMR